jgi:hypothetical protein
MDQNEAAASAGKDELCVALESLHWNEILHERATRHGTELLNVCRAVRDQWNIFRHWSLLVPNLALQLSSLQLSASPWIEEHPRFLKRRAALQSKVASFQQFAQNAYKDVAEWDLEELMMECATKVIRAVRDLAEVFVCHGDPVELFLRKGDKANTAAVHALVSFVLQGRLRHFIAISSRATEPTELQTMINVVLSSDSSTLHPVLVPDPEVGASMLWPPSFMLLSCEFDNLPDFGNVPSELAHVDIEDIVCFEQICYNLVVAPQQKVNVMEGAPSPPPSPLQALPVQNATPSDIQNKPLARGHRGRGQSRRRAQHNQERAQKFNVVLAQRKQRNIG